MGLPLKLKYFALGNGERNDYKKETITLPAAKRTKRAQRSKQLENFEKSDSMNSKRIINAKKTLLKFRIAI